MARQLFYSAPFGVFLLSLDCFSHSVAIHLSAANETLPRGEEALLTQPYLRGQAEDSFGLPPSSQPTFLQKGFFGGRKRKEPPSFWATQQGSGSSNPPQTEGANESPSSPLDPFANIPSGPLGGPTEEMSQPGDFDDFPHTGGTGGITRRRRRGPVYVDPVFVGSTIRRGAESFQKKKQTQGPRPVPISERRYSPASALGGPTPIQEVSEAGTPTPPTPSGDTSGLEAFVKDLGTSLPSLSSSSQPSTPEGTEDPWIPRGPPNQFPSQGSAQSPFAAPHPPFQPQAPTTPTAQRGAFGFPFSQPTASPTRGAFGFPSSTQGPTGRGPRFGAPVLPPFPSGGVPKLRATLSQDGDSSSTPSEAPTPVRRGPPPKPPRRNPPVSSASLDDGSTGTGRMPPVPLPRKTPPKPPRPSRSQSLDASQLLGGPSASAPPPTGDDDEDDGPPDFVPPPPPGKIPRNK